MIAAVFLAGILGATGTTYNAELVSCYDGDTCRFNIDTGIDRVWVMNRVVRLCDIDTPEVTENPKVAKFARDMLVKWIKAGTKLQIKVPEKKKYGSFGRLLAWVIVNDRNLNEKLLEQGLAEPFRKKCK